MLPRDAQETAQAFAVAYLQHDARDGHDTSYSSAGERAARYATADLGAVLSQKRPGQEAPWSALRREQALVTTKVPSVSVPDGAPAPDASSALARVSYVLTTTPRSGEAQRAGGQFAVRLARTANGWQVSDLPWA
ncbi:hypothetical protein [Streptomyces sp. NPDC051561]|uniref:hypothetical protein n=1 Tax=Streptomyces sp. NPDC051561 TaxID=3365658 RepID=UPI0037A19BDE